MEPTPCSPPSQLWTWPGEDSRFSCLFYSVLCTRTRSTLPRPWVLGLFIACYHTRGHASTASWPGWAEQPGTLRTWEVELLKGIILEKGKLGVARAGRGGSASSMTGYTGGESSQERPPSGILQWHSHGCPPLGLGLRGLAKHQSGSREMQPPGLMQQLLIVILTPVGHVHDSLQNPLTL
jgi:hypothetical protein